MRVEEIEIHTGFDFDRPYERIGSVQAKVSSPTIFNRARTVEEVNSRLREKALGMGANAVIGVVYDRGISAFSWKSLMATGIAIRVT